MAGSDSAAPAATGRSAPGSTPRGILKRTASVLGDNQGQPAAAAAAERAQAVRARWDEKNLAENAEYMAANPKMKIDEPPTPYHRYQEEADADLQENLRRQDSVEAEGDPSAADVTSRVQMAAAVLGGEGRRPAAAASSPRSISSGSNPVPSDQRSSGDSPRDPRKHEEFIQKRRAVYAAEGASFKALLRQGMPVDDDDDDDNEPETAAQ
eukprot:TRINITY_DN64842_c0_g1_i1.p2 TRINITY_DN64842_c0_g1~~TRINITY_DN64842_c0_g1_i1.p2  ORF type:complete len:240 (+),score=82.58 TRINITY_DN64842_c0_g1_i1:92-721(+)